jgi:hypothetical protein
LRIWPRCRRLDHFRHRDWHALRLYLAAFQPHHPGNVGEEARHARGVLLDAGEQIGTRLRRQRSPGGA